jgi:hypothetical protein
VISETTAILKVADSSLNTVPPLARGGKFYRDSPAN